MYMLSNDVYANVSTGESRLIEPRFRGTMIYWELDHGK